MMRTITGLVVIAVLTVSVSGCGLRGSLKSPSQIAYQKEKEERRAAKKAGMDVAAEPAMPATEPTRQYDDLLSKGAHPNQPSTHGTYK